ncbi:MAG: hypothetical protein FJ005_06270 [Chloroflexi bacterium]|nr:hypothetical protein [Chloroflexota bacterium]
MWRSKKFIIVAVLAAVLLSGSIGAVALAADNGDDSQPKARCGALLDRVCEIYQQKTGDVIDQEVLKEAFAQAQREMREEALDNYLKNLVAQGKITQEQADQYKNWQQSRPDTEQFRQQLKVWQQERPGIPPELKEWQEERPDVPLGFGPRGHGGFPGMGRFPGWAGPCMPPNK